MQSQAAAFYERVGRTYDTVTGEWVGGIPAGIGEPISLTNAEVGKQRAAAKELLEAAAAGRRKKLAVASAALADMPPELREIISTIWADDGMNDAAKVMLENERSFASPTAALLTGIALNTAARTHFASKLDEWWNGSTVRSGAYHDEIIIGGGLHAAIYSAVRVAKGFPRPVVLERSGRVGGALAVTLDPSFILNSRNRPGDLSVPRQPGALNVLPGAPVQPSNLSNEEYQTNAPLAYVIRSTLAMHARVATSWPATSLYIDEGFDGESLVVESDRGPLYANRVILATGLNNPLSKFAKNERVLGWAEYMQRKENNLFPLQGMRRVAVIGSGDGGKTVVEDLIGQGPQSGWSVASKDWVEQIDWYGVPQETRQEWEAVSRSRYRGIGRAFPDDRRDDDRVARIKPQPRASKVYAGYNSAYVDGVPYDYVIDCTGYQAGTTVGNNLDDEGSIYTVSGRAVAKAVMERIFTVGPAARLEIEDFERTALAGIPENSTALFRYAAQTAALAASLT